MNKAELVKKIQHLEKEVQEASIHNKHVLDAHQVVNSQLIQYVREQEDKLRNFKEEFMLQVHTLRQDAAKLNNEYRQELCALRGQWAKTFVFTEAAPIVAPPVQETQ